MHRPTAIAIVLSATLVTGACADGGAAEVPVGVTVPPSSSTTSPAPSTTSTAPTSVPTSVPATTTTIPEYTLGSPVDAIAVDVPTIIGRSVEGRAIEVIRRGDPGGVRVFAIGSIHGDEPAGVEIIRGPATQTGALGPMTSIYFRDPNGYVIELTAKKPGHDAAMDPARNGARANLDAWQRDKAGA